MNWKPAFLLALAMALTGCGFGTSGASNTAAPNSTLVTNAPTIRLLSPPDLDGDGFVDGVPHPSLTRIAIQVPDTVPVSLSRNGVELPHERLQAGGITEIVLASPIGAQPATLLAGAYRVVIQPSAELATGTKLAVRPVGRNAVANEVVGATGAVFESPDDVGLLVSGALPALIGLPLELHNGATGVALAATVTRAGVLLSPQSRLQPGRVYTLRAADGATDCLGNPLAPDFRLLCRHPRGTAAIRICVADIDRDGAPDIVALYADGSIAAVTDTAAPAEILLPPAPGRAIDLALGDFDGNGAPDVAMLRADEHGFHLVRLINDSRRGRIQFTSAIETLVLEQPLALRAADFDRDGRDDLCVLDAFGAVHLLPTSGERRVVNSLGARRLAARLCVPDADGDGKPDLAVLAADGTLRILFNRDGLSPENAKELALPGAQRAAWGLLNADRAADFVFTGGNSVSAWMGESDAPAVIGIRVEAEVAAGGGRGLFSGAAIVRDVNRDSRDDVLVMREDAMGISDDVAVYMNSNLGSALPDAILPLGARLRVHDMEFWRDHVVFATDARLLILKVNAEELPPSVESSVRFIEAYSPVPQIPAPLAAAVGDFNDDGRADIAAIDRDGNLRVYLSGAPGEPFAAISEPVPVGGPGTLKAIDFNRNGAPDLLYIPADIQRKPRILRNTGSGSFDSSDNNLLPTPPTGLRGAPALGDFDVDGDLDVLWPSAHGRVQFNDGVGWRDGGAVIELRDSSQYRLLFSGELTCADFTGDGIADVVAVMQARDDAPQQLVLFEGTGINSDGVNCFRPVISDALRGRIFDLTPADFDGDGRLDLAIGYAPENETARLTLLRLGADRQFAPFEGAPAAKGRLLDIALDDLDRDGDLDLIVTEDIAGQGIEMTLWINDGKGRYSEGGAAADSLRRAVGDFRATNLSLADFTGDGRSDLLAIDADGNVVLVRSYLP